MKYLLLLTCLLLTGCSDNTKHYSSNRSSYYNSNHQYQLEEEIDELRDQNEELESEVYTLKDRVMQRDYNGEDATKYYDEYDDMETYEIESEISSKEDQIYDNEMEIIDKEYELDMTY